MTGPVTTEAMVESLRKSLAMAANDPGNVIRADGTRVGYKGDRCMGGWIADAILAGPLAPLLAALQQVTAERDGARADLKTAEDSNDALNMKLHTLAPHGSCACSYDRPGDVCEHHSPFLATATSELARLRAEVEAKDRALKAKAEEQVAYWRERQRAEKCLEDGISEDGQTYTPIGDVAAWQGGYCNGRLSEADWWAKTFQYWPNEAARAATAREGQADE